jgi:hypothetical protein
MPCFKKRNPAIAPLLTPSRESPNHKAMLICKAFPAWPPSPLTSTTHRSLRRGDENSSGLIFFRESIPKKRQTFCSAAMPCLLL